MTTLPGTTDPATEPEILVFQALLDLGKVPGEDFSFQSSILGGRQERGGLVLDFVIPPDLVISVLGEYFHYRLNGGSAFEDLAARATLAAQGQFLIFIDESDILRDARYYVSEALNYRDHSRMGRS